MKLIDELLEKDSFNSGHWTDTMLHLASNNMIVELIAEDKFVLVDDAVEFDPIIGRRVLRACSIEGGWILRKELDDIDIEKSVKDSMKKILIRLGTSDSWYNPKVEGGKNWK